MQHLKSLLSAQRFWQVLEYRVRIRRGEDSSWSSSKLVRTESSDTVFTGKTTNKTKKEIEIKESKLNKAKKKTNRSKQTCEDRDQ